MIESYSVGIDLGTTNAVVAYTPVGQGKALEPAQILPIGQWVAEGVWQEKPLFPTYRYHTLPHESALLQPLAFPFRPLDNDFPVIYGEFAVRLGATNRGQGVSSAKSWLSQASRVHRDAQDAFLPWGIGEDLAASIKQVSPLMASASYLHYIHSWWNHKFPEFPLSEQRVVITLPASFDEYARDLTMAAAEVAGLGQAQFLEEPTAAAYAWFDNQGDQQAKKAAEAGVMCILDVGGGTTDLSLINFSNPEKPERLSVGEHLMLGGDNLDAALAQSALVQMTEEAGQKIQMSAAQWAQLMLAARDGKERIFSGEDLQEETLTLSLLGRGRSLIAKQRQAVLKIADIRQQLFEGFLPQLDFNDQTQVTEKKGLVEIGLQFEQDTAITRHLLQFLQQADSRIDSVLLNGGFFQADGFCDAIQRQFDHWSTQAWADHKVQLIKTENPQTAVAIGAVSYCEARRLQALQKETSNTQQVKAAPIIGGGAPRSLFLALSGGEQTATQAVCVTVKGMPEAESFELAPEFHLAVNRPVQFSLYSTTKKINAQLGDLVDIDSQWSQLPAMQVQIDVASDESIQEVAVRLITEVTIVGALQLQFKAMSNTLKMPDTLLEFAGRSGAAGVRLNKKHLPHTWPEVVEAFENVYGAKKAGQQNQAKNDKEAFAQLRKKLDTLGSRSDWNITICRSLADLFLKWRKNRRRSARHESFWLTQLAYVIRPGYGVVGDINRLEYIRDILETPPAYHEHDVWFGWWTLVRRAAGGLDATYQQWLFETHEAKLKSLMDFLQQAGKSKSKPAKKGAKPTLSKKEQDLKNRAPEAMLRAIASLDHIRGRSWFEEKLFKLLKVEAMGVNQQVIAWCLGLVVNRYPQIQGDTEFTPLSSTVVTEQVKLWLGENWQQCPELGLASSFAVQNHPDETIALPEDLRKEVIKKLDNSKLPVSWKESITDSSSSAALSDALAGDSLPHGLRIG